MSVQRNTFVNLIGSIIPMVVMLITVPLYLKILGDVRYGVLALVWLVLGYFGFLEMGLGRATSNHIARLRDALAEERGVVFWTAILVNATFGAVASLLLWLTGTYLLTSVLNIPVEFRKEALSALPWMVATLPVALVSSVLNGSLEGRNRFLTVNCLQVTTVVFFQVVPLIVAYRYSPSLSVVIPAAILTRAFMNVLFLYACFNYIPLTFKFSFSRKAAKSLLSYGGWVAVSGMISPLLETFDRFLIGIVLGAQAVTYYTLPYQLVTKARVLPLSLSRVLFPKFSADNAKDSQALALKSLRVLLVVITPVIICGIVLLKPFMIIWVGNDIANVASPLGVILFLGLWGNCLAHIPFYLLQGKGRPDIVAKLHVLEIGPFILVLYFSLDFFGLYGAAWAWTVRVLVDAALMFHYSGMLKACVRIACTPAAIVVSATVGSYYAALYPWPWRLALFILLSLCFCIWLLNGDRRRLLDEAFQLRKTRSSVKEGH